MKRDRPTEENAHTLYRHRLVAMRRRSGDLGAFERSRVFSSELARVAYLASHQDAWRGSRRRSVPRRGNA